MLTEGTTLLLSCLAAREAAQLQVTDFSKFGTLASAAWLTPTLWRNASWLGPVQTSFQTTERELWLTIDDGPTPTQTPYILDVLAQHGVTASFFVIGQHLRAQPDIARRIIAENHTLENHTETHPSASFWAALPRTIRREIANTSKIIHDLSGQWPTRFRAPVGMANPFVHRTVQELQLTLTGWNASGHDGLPHHPDRVLSRIQSQLQPGGIILLHDSQLTGMSPGSRAKTLDRLLQHAHAEGYRFIIPEASGSFTR